MEGSYCKFNEGSCNKRDGVCNDDERDKGSHDGGGGNDGDDDGLL